MKLLSLTCSFSGFALLCLCCLPPGVHLPPPRSGGPPHRAGRSVFSAMKLGKNRPHKEEPQRQGTDKPGAISQHLAETKPPRSAGSTPTRLSCDWPPRLPGRALASHWLPASRVLKVVFRKGALLAPRVGRASPLV